MAGVNRVTLLGYLGRDPEIRYTPSGTAVASFSIATTETWKNRDGEKQEHTEWHQIVAWSRLAEICSEYLAKGSQVYIEGRIRTNEWEDTDGNKRSKKEVIASTVQFLSRSESARTEPNAATTASEPSGTESDIPF